MQFPGFRPRTAQYKQQLATQVAVYRQMTTTWERRSSCQPIRLIPNITWILHLLLGVLYTRSQPFNNLVYQAQALRFRNIVAIGTSKLGSNIRGVVGEILGYLAWGKRDGVVRSEVESVEDSENVVVGEMHYAEGLDEVFGREMDIGYGHVGLCGGSRCQHAQNSSSSVGRRQVNIELGCAYVVWSS